MIYHVIVERKDWGNGGAIYRRDIEANSEEEAIKEARLGCGVEDAYIDENYSSF